MSPPEPVPGLSAVADRYDAVLCDVWGVIHNGRESFPDACAALARFGRDRGPVVLISNAPRPGDAVLPQLRELNVPADAFAALVTSGDATRRELARRAPGPVWAVGPERDAPLYAGLDLRFAGPAEAAFICCTGLVDDETETAEDYREVLAAAAARGLTFLCANPDRVVQRGDRLIPCAGALADLYEELGGQVVMAGKPFAPIYDLAYAEAERLAGRPLDRARILAIGDGAPTDLKGADNQGLDCLFVADGIHAAEVCGPDGQPDPDRAAAFLASAGTRARYISGPLRP
jgi:HAD superfamily hydrolase (TIGR01459 family)